MSDAGEAGRAGRRPEEIPPAEELSPRMDPPVAESPPSAGSSAASAPPPAANPPAEPPSVPPALLHPALEPPSADVAPVGADTTLPGMHRGGFERWPTAPVGVTPVVTAPDPDAPILMWAPVEPRAPSRGMAGWALAFAIIALVVAMFVGWGFPIGIVAIVTAIVALRRPLESRAVAVWAIVLGAVSLLYSAGWLLYAASRSDMMT